MRAVHIVPRGSHMRADISTMVTSDARTPESMLTPAPLRTVILGLVPRDSIRRWTVRCTALVWMLLAPSSWIPVTIIGSFDLGTSAKSPRRLLGYPRVPSRTFAYHPATDVHRAS